MKKKPSLTQFAMALSETFNDADILIEPIGNSECRHCLSVREEAGTEFPIGFAYTTKCDVDVEPGLYKTIMKGKDTLVSYFEGYLTLMYPLQSSDTWIERYTDIFCVKDADSIFDTCNN